MTEKQWEAHVRMMTLILARVTGRAFYSAGDAIGHELVAAGLRPPISIFGYGHAHEPGDGSGLCPSCGRKEFPR